MKNEVFIYELVDPHTNAVRYVGRTRFPEKRLKGHIREAQGIDNLPRSSGAIAKAAWINKLLEEESTPIMRVIERCPRQRQTEREDYWIERNFESGAELFNMRRVSIFPVLTIQYEDGVIQDDCVDAAA